VRLFGPLLCLCLIAGSTYAASSQPHVLPLDVARSQATFTVKVLWVLGLRGEFGTVRGDVDIDHFHGTARVHASIATANLRMRSQHYENWARSAEFFDAQHYPAIEFTSATFPLARLRHGGPVDGELSLRGITHPVRLELQPAECASPLAGTCAVIAEGAIRRGDFGMRSHHHTVADKVALRLRIFVVPPRDPAS
jgi:polyisoprenoid-binding protein YceI